MNDRKAHCGKNGGEQVRREDRAGKDSSKFFFFPFFPTFLFHLN